MLDEQDLNELIGLVEIASGSAIATSVITGEKSISTRVVSLKALETKLIRMKQGLEKEDE